MSRTILAAAALAALPALAHHGWSEYDSSKPLTLTGTILESGYEHPHGHVRLQTPQKTWMVILAPPSRMENRGLPAAEIAKGKTVTVVGYANRDQGRRDARRADHGRGQDGGAALTPSGNPIEALAFARAMREQLWLYPSVEIVHIIGLAILVGSIVMFDLRVLGLSRGIPVRALRRHLLPWSLGALVLIVPTGMLMFSAHASDFIGNRAFQVKMALLMTRASTRRSSTPGPTSPLRRGIRTPRAPGATSIGGALDHHLVLDHRLRTIAGISVIQGPVLALDLEALHAAQVAAAIGPHDHHLRRCNRVLRERGDVHVVRDHHRRCPRDA
jgi:hypothetical protein